MPASFQSKFRRTSAHLALLALATFGVSSCKSDSESFTGPLTRVEVRTDAIGAPTTNLGRSITLKLRAVPVNADENLVDTPVTWSSSDNTRATVDGTGLVTTVGGGDVTISATAEGVTGGLLLNIQFGVGTVTLGPPNPTIRQEGAVTLTATVLGTDGKPALGRPVTWLSSNPAVATVSATGVVAGLTNGTTTITATSEGVPGTTVITVSGSPIVSTVAVTPNAPFKGVGQTVQLSYVASAGSGTVIPGTTATWSSSSPAIASVDNNGLVTINAPGTATITARVDNGIGVNVSGTSSVVAAPLLAKGVATAVPTVATAGVFLYAYEVPAGATSLTITSTGGSGDADVYIFAPGVVPSALSTNPNALAFSNSTQFSALGGNAESITRPTPAAGTWRIYINAWAGDVAVTGLSITANHAP